MPGIRLHHETLAAPSVVAVECARGYAQPYVCPLCSTTHQHKTVHLRLDGDGNVIVSKGVWADLKDVPGLPFAIANEVRKPPKIILSLDPQVPTDVPIDVHPHRFAGRR